MDEQLQPGLGALLRVARRSLGLTQAQVGQAVGLAPAVYGRLERGDGLPSVGTLMALCSALNASADTLLAMRGLVAPPPPASPEDSPELRRLRDYARGLPPNQLRVLELLARLFSARGGK
jgi:transcriptional regulator with XRE-family HTH domain